LTDLTAAIETPGLPPDLLVDAHLKRARCRAEAGNFDDALGDIDLAESAAGEMDQVHLTRGIVFRLQGNQTAAQREFQQAKQINPKLQLPR
jgi:Tfp pilus assembly protein PilF